MVMRFKNKIISSPHLRLILPSGGEDSPEQGPALEIFLKHISLSQSASLSPGYPGVQTGPAPGLD